MNRCCRFAIITALVCGLIPSLSQAATFLVTNRAGLAANDFVDWSTVGPEGTPLVSPFIIASHSTPPNHCTVTNASGTFIRLDQSSGWNGNFAPGDALLYTNGSVGPITIEFLNPVAAAGVQLQPHTIPGNFTATLQVFNDTNNLIGSFTQPGNSTGAADNSAIFLGVQATYPVIKRIQYSVVDGVGASVPFAINRLGLQSADSGGGGGAAPAVSLLGVVLLSGLLGAVGMRMRRRQV